MLRNHRNTFSPLWRYVSSHSEVAFFYSRLWQELRCLKLRGNFALNRMICAIVPLHFEPFSYGTVRLRQEIKFAETLNNSQTMNARKTVEKVSTKLSKTVEKIELRWDCRKTVKKQSKKFWKTIEKIFWTTVEQLSNNASKNCGKTTKKMQKNCRKLWKKLQKNRSNNLHLYFYLNGFPQFFCSFSTVFGNFFAVFLQFFWSFFCNLFAVFLQFFCSFSSVFFQIFFSLFFRFLPFSSVFFSFLQFFLSFYAHFF